MSGVAPTSGIRVLLIDALELFRASLARFLAQEAEFEVAGTCGSTADALTILGDGTSRPVDVALLDYDLEPERASDFIPAARNTGYRGKFLILAGVADARHSALAIRQGASGIFLKSEPPERLIEAIRQVARGEVWVDRRVIQLMADQVVEHLPPVDLQIGGEHLGEREQKVLLGILGGLSNRKIGSNLGISEGSVKNVVQSLFTRAGVRRRSQLVRIALEGSLGSLHQALRTDANGQGLRT